MVVVAVGVVAVAGAVLDVAAGCWYCAGGAGEEATAEPEASGVEAAGVAADIGSSSCVR